MACIRVQDRIYFSFQNVALNLRSLASDNVEYRRIAVEVGWELRRIAEICRNLGTWGKRRKQAVSRLEHAAQNGPIATYTANTLRWRWAFLVND